MAAASTNQASPLVHAIGGSLGSALALLLFYPLERARIELQSQASHQPNKQHAQQLQDNSDEKIVQESIEVDVEVDLDGPSSTTKGHRVDASSPSSSWSPIHGGTPGSSEIATSTDEMSPSWDMESSSTTNSKDEASDKIAQTSAEPSSKSSLLKCLVHLHSQGALYQGVTPVITTIFASQFAFFFLLSYIKNLMLQIPFFGGSTSSRRPSASSRAILSLASSCVAGIGNVLMTNPLWVANIAIVTGEAKTGSLLKELVSIFRARGLKHLWSGTGASILLVSNPVIQFFSYEQIKQARFAYAGQIDTLENAVLPPMEAFVAGAVAKTIATVLTYPLQLTQTVLRLDNSAYAGIMDCLVKLHRRAGYKEWYTGMRAKLLQTVLTAAFTFLTYEQILGAVQLALIRSAGLPAQSSL